MPWITSDVDGFKKGLSRKQKRKWVSIANGALAGCVDNGGVEKDCARRAVRIANSKFKEFNPVITGEVADKIEKIIHLAKEVRGSEPVDARDEKPKKDNSEMFGSKKFQHKKITPPDAIDGHTHTAVYDEDGNGATDLVDDHHHMIFYFKVQPYYYFDSETREEYSSVHPGSFAFSKYDVDGQINTALARGMLDGMNHDQMEALKACIAKGGVTEDCINAVRKMTASIEEMEIFRAGTHNGDEFTEKDLAEIADNFRILKDHVRPKLKITHHGDGDEQVTLAGLASYGDVVDVFINSENSDGEKRLYCKVVNVPPAVLEWIRDGRFSERSIEIYPEFRVGAKKDSPVYRNVLKAVALLGHEMPAVTGMAPVRLSEFHENQRTICFTDICFLCDEMAEKWMRIVELELEIKTKIFK